MAYVLHFSNAWERSYKNIDNTAKERIEEALLRIIEDPYKGKGLSGNLRGLWSFRTGKYRILYEIKEETREVFIEAVGLRKNIYK